MKTIKKNIRDIVLTTSAALVLSAPMLSSSGPQYPHQQLDDLQHIAEQYEAHEGFRSGVENYALQLIGDVNGYESRTGEYIKFSPEIRELQGALYRGETSTDTH